MAAREVSVSMLNAARIFFIHICWFVRGANGLFNQPDQYSSTDDEASTCANSLLILSLGPVWCCLNTRVATRRG